MAKNIILCFEKITGTDVFKFKDFEALGKDSTFILSLCCKMEENGKGFYTALFCFSHSVKYF